MSRDPAAVRRNRLALCRHGRGRGAGRGARRRGADPDPRGQQQRHCAVGRPRLPPTPRRRRPCRSIRSPTPTCRAWRQCSTWRAHCRSAWMRGPAPWQCFPASTRPPSSARARGRSIIHALDNILLPRLIFRLEAQMRQNFNNPDFLYQATRVYLMLGSAGAARSRSGEGVDALRLAGGVSRSRRAAAARRRWSSTSPRCSTSRCRR